MVVAGEPVDLTVEQEEIATMYVACMDSEHVRNPTFNANFFKGWKEVLGSVSTALAPLGFGASCSM